MISDNIYIRFLSGVFFDYEIPKEKRFLIKYFNKNEIMRSFLKYVLCFGIEYRTYFFKHTGYRDESTDIYRHTRQYNYIIEIYKKAKEEGDISLMAEIECGKHKNGYLMIREPKYDS